jgi:hypothetical protein
MRILLRRFLRRLAPVCLALGLLAGPTLSHTARAQQPGAPETAAASEDKGRPLDGYLATLVLVMLALFLVGKSARR